MIFCFAKKSAVLKRKYKILTHTIIAVSTGEADTSREPEGDQAMEVTGE